MKEYYSFLGIEDVEIINDLAVVGTDNRDILIGGMFYYPVIISKIQDKIVISCSKKYKEEVKSYFNTIKVKSGNNIAELLTVFANHNFQKFEMKEMDRLIKLKPNEKIDCNEVELIDEYKKEYFYNIVKQQKEKAYKEAKWKEFHCKKAPFRNELWNNQRW